MPAHTAGYGDFDAGAWTMTSTHDLSGAVSTLVGLDFTFLPGDPPRSGRFALATALAATYGLRAADAVHLATAVGAGADRFITSNNRDFAKTIVEIDVTYPADLANGA